MKQQLTLLIGLLLLSLPLWGQQHWPNSGRSTTVSAAAPPTVVFTITNVTCFGATDGCATAVVTGSSAGQLSYLWSTGATTATICNLAAGTYFVTVTDTLPPLPPGPINLYEEDFDSVHAWTLSNSTGTNGLEPNVWQVNDEEGGVAPTGCGVANNGNSTLHLTCTSLFCGSLITGAVYNATQETNVRAESPIFSTVGYTGNTLTFDFIANGDGVLDNASLLYNAGAGWQVLDGSLKSMICATLQGEWTAYTVTLPAACDNNPTVQLGFNWTNNADNIGTDPSVAINNIVVSNVTTGIPQLSIVVADTLISQAQFLLVSSIDSIAGAICEGDSNGLINLAISGGALPYTFTWSTGATTQNLANVANGLYIVTISDNNGCTALDTALVPLLGLITVAIDSSANPLCNGDSTGFLMASAIGDTTLSNCSSPVVRLNEFLYRPTATRSNGVDPNTGEYIELIGPPGTDISCYVLTDGDWTITMPAGSTIPSDGFFTIGNDIVWGAGTFDLDAENCNCFTDGPTGNGEGLLILTDGGETISMFDATGAFLDGVVFGSPTGANQPFGSIVTTIGLTGCVTAVTIPAATAFSSALGGLQAGTALVRAPDGSGNWVAQIGGSLNACNNVNSTGAGGAITYLWSNGDTSRTLTGLAAGTYSVVATNALGCSDTASFTLVAPNVLVVTDSLVNIACMGNTTGSINLTVSGGTAPYRFAWDNGATSEDLDSLSAGTYCGTVTDANGCAAVLCATLIEDSLNIPIDTLYICPGDSVQLQVNTSLTSVRWTPSNTLSNDTILNPFARPTTTTTYRVSNGVLSGNDLIVNGDFSAGNVGFTSNYTNYAGGIGDAYIIDTNARTYNTQHSGFDHTTGSGNFLIADAPNGSVDVWCQTVTVLPNTDYDFSMWVNNIVRPTSNFGDPTIEATINGVSVVTEGPIAEVPDVWINATALWNSGTATSATICIRAVGVVGGGHDFGLDDISFLPVGGGCSMQDSVVVVVQPLDLTGTLVTNVACFGDSTGSIVTNLFGNNYSYLWSTGDTTASLTTLSAGSYVLTVTNTSGCTDSATFTITQPATPLGVTVVSTNIACMSDSTGSIDLTVTGGTIPYSFAWDNGATGEDLANLTVGTYCGTVTDDNGCFAVLCATLSEDSLDIPVDTLYLCVGDSIQLLVNTTVSSVRWTPAGSLSNDTLFNPFVSPTVTTTYVVSAVGGCVMTDSVVVVIGGSLNLNLAMTTTPNCFGDSTGSIMTSSTSTNLSYLWNTGDTTANLANLLAGMYSVVASDSSNCQDTLMVTLTQPDSLQLIVGATTPVTCRSGADGTVALSTVTGGIPGYTYLWSNTATTDSLDNLTAGTYVLTVTDANGCIVIGNATVTQPFDSINIGYSAVPVSCGNTNDGSVTALPIKGIPTYLYQWGAAANNQTSATATNLPSGTYTVTVTDAIGCTATANGIFIPANVAIDSSALALAAVDSTLTCDLLPTGILQINTTNTYTYLWSNGATTQQATALAAGAYSVTVSNNQNCSLVLYDSITAPFVPEVNPFIEVFGNVSSVGSANDVFNIGVGNDQTSLGVQYDWTVDPTATIANGSAPNTTVSADRSGTYTLVIVATANDADACQDTGSVTLIVESVYLGMPTAFTPNGDGVNDLFRPIGLTDIDVRSFKIYNRWGQIVYEGDALNNSGWDGRFQGAEQPTEEYIFVLEYKIGTQAPKAHKGGFTLIR